MVLAAFSITPIGVGGVVAAEVAEAVRVVRESGLPNRTDGSYGIPSRRKTAVVAAAASAATRTTAAVSSRRSAQGGREIRWRSTGPANRNANVPTDSVIRPAANSVGSFMPVSFLRRLRTVRAVRAGRGAGTGWWPAR